MKVVIVFAVFAAVFVGCRAVNQSNVKDIFAEDEGDDAVGNARRRPATPVEKTRVVKLTSCTGTWLTKNYVLTAAHCSADFGPENSMWHGTADIWGPATLKIEKVVEVDDGLDFAILKVRHLDQSEAQKIATTSRIVVDQSELTLNAGAPGESIFTIGYPGDKRSWKGTFAAGNARIIKDRLLYFDVGITNGNSGGSVVVTKTGALAAMTNGGPRMLGTVGWRNNAVDDAGAWNNGAGLWEIYRASNFLKTVFPNGLYDEGGEQDWISREGETTTIPVSDPSHSSAQGDNLIAFYNVYFSEAELNQGLLDFDSVLQSSGESPIIGYAELERPRLPIAGLDVPYTTTPTEACELDGYIMELRGEVQNVVSSILLIPRLRNPFCFGRHLIDTETKVFTSIQNADRSHVMCNQMLYAADSREHGQIRILIEAFDQNAQCKLDRVDAIGKFLNKTGTEQLLFGARIELSFY